MCLNYLGWQQQGRGVSGATSAAQPHGMHSRVMLRGKHFSLTFCHLFQEKSLRSSIYLPAHEHIFTPSTFVMTFISYEMFFFYNF